LLASISYLGAVGNVVNGKFEITVGRRPSDNELTILGVDTKTKKLTDIIKKKLTGNKINIGQIVACASEPEMLNDGLVA
jgi:hypothetical protein